jgi:hypothetical protein
MTDGEAPRSPMRTAPAALAYLDDEAALIGASVGRTSTPVVKTVRNCLIGTPRNSGIRLRNSVASRCGYSPLSRPSDGPGCELPSNIQNRHGVVHHQVKLHRRTVATPTSKIGWDSPHPCAGTTPNISPWLTRRSRYSTADSIPSWSQ